MPKIPVTFDDVKTLAERNKVKMLNDSDMFGVEVAQEIKGLTKEDALETLGINGLDGRVDTVEGEIDDLQTAETDIKGNGWTNENLVDHESRITQNESDIVALKGSGWAGQTVKGNADAIAEKESIVNVNTLKGAGWTDETVKGNAEDIATLESNLDDAEIAIDTLNADDTTEGSVLKSIKDNAEDATYDNIDSGLTASTIKTAIDEVEGRVDTAESEIDELQTAETAIKGTGWTNENLVDHEDRLDTLEADSATEGSVAYDIKQSSDAIKGVGYTEGTLKSHEDRLGTLEGADTIEGSVAKTVKDAVDPIIEDVSDHETRIEALEDEPNQGEEGKSAYDIYVETTSDSPVKTEEQWLASLKGADGKSAYEYAEEEGYEGTEGEFAEALADVENKIDKSKIVTTWDTSPKDDEVPSALLVYNSLDGGGGGGGGEARDFVIIGIDGTHGATEYDVAWGDIVKDQPTWHGFWSSFSSSLPKVFKFLDGTYTVPSDVYDHTNSDGYVIFPSTGFSYEGVSGMAIIVANPPMGGTVFLPFGYGVSFKNLWIKNNGMATFGIEVSGGSAGIGSHSYLENVVVEDMVAVGMVFSGALSNISLKNCKAINCGSAYAGQQASGIAVTETNSHVPSNIVIDGCTVIGGAYAGIGLVGAEDCKVVNCHVEDYGAIGAGAIGGKRNIFANNTIIRDTQANPQSGEFGLLLNETDRAIVTGNIVENGHIMDNDSNDCLVENNIGDVLNNDRGLLNPTNGKFYDYTIGVSGADGALIPEFIFTEVE